MTGGSVLPRRLDLDAADQLDPALDGVRLVVSCVERPDATLAATSLERGIGYVEVGRSLDALERTLALNSAAMSMRLTGAGSQYLIATLDAQRNHFDGARTYRVTLPPGIPAEEFWSLTIYGNQTRSMLQTPQRYPRAGSQSYPSPAAVPDPDGSTTVYFGPRQPNGVPRSNWIQTVPR